MFLIITVAPSFGTATTQTMEIISPNMIVIKFVCVGTAVDYVTTYKDAIQGYYIYRIIIESLAASDAVTDNSDVYIYDEYGTDLLSGEGVDQLDDSTRNYIELTEYSPIIGNIKITVANQAEAAGVYTVTLVLVK